MWRSSDGKTRIDTPQSSVISDPVSQQTIVLDHVKKEASVIPWLRLDRPLRKRAQHRGLPPREYIRHPCRCRIWANR